MKASALMLDNSEAHRCQQQGLIFPATLSGLPITFRSRRHLAKTVPAAIAAWEQIWLLQEHSVPYKSIIQSHSLAPHKHVFRQGENAEALYIVRAGSVKLYYVSASGKEQVLVVSYAGRSTGAGCTGCRQL